MKRIVLLLTAGLLLNGCATSSTYVMQPDHSYLIDSSRPTIFAPSEKNEAHEMASKLCPKGYKVDTEFQKAFKQYTLVIHCESGREVSSFKE